MAAVLQHNADHAKSLELSPHKKASEPKKKSGIKKSSRAT